MPQWDNPLQPPRDLSSKEGRLVHARACRALQALAAGEASPEQQKAALDYIIYDLCGTYDMEVRLGGEDGRRASDIAGGRRFVGLQLVLCIRTNINTLLQKDDADDEQGTPAPQ